MREHAKLSRSIHGEAVRWADAMSRINDELLRDYLQSFEDRDDTPRIRVWKRIVVQEAHRRRLDLRT